MQIKVPHQGTQAEGIARVNVLLKEHRDKIEKEASDVSTEWKENVLHFAFVAQGSHISGTLTVLDKEYELYAKLPLALRLFEGTIERMIEAEVKKIGL